MLRARRQVEVPRTLVPLLLIVLAGCQLVEPPVPTPVPAGIGQLEVRAIAGPVCPVETDPPDPGCAPRPVSDAPVFVQPGDGRDIVVAQGVADADGVLAFDLPGGEYFIAGGDVVGLMGRPEPVLTLVREHATVTVELVWDTGIR
jgi:hypothetical protein